MPIRNNPPGPALERSRLHSLNAAISGVKAALGTLESEVGRYRRDVSNINAELEGLMGYALAASGRAESAMAWIEKRLVEIAPPAEQPRKGGDDAT